MKEKELIWEKIPAKEEETNKMTEGGRDDGWHDGLQLGKLMTSFTEVGKSRKRKFKGSCGMFG